MSHDMWHPSWDKSKKLRMKKNLMTEPVKKSCTHRLACCSGDKILNSVDIVQNCTWTKFIFFHLFLVLNTPIVAYKRHNIYRQIHRSKIRRRIGGYLDIQCYADSIPQSSIFWVKETKKKSEREVVGNQSFLQFSVNSKLTYLLQSLASF